ncbi:unnamed protein product [Amoebophrya sp. A120]|nr:unnamed protein product [Amoebophrya sp. A120]|eukprot:GSA120T00016279001.1
MTEGGYLIYTEDSLGTLFLKWSKEPVENALAFFEAGKPIPAFKFTTNQGRFQLMKGCQDKQKFFEGWGAFLKEALCRFNATSLAVYAKQNAREDVQVVFLERGTSAVQRIEPNGKWSGDITSLFAFAVVPVDNETYNCGTLDQNLFVSKGQKAGAAFPIEGGGGASGRATVAVPSLMLGEKLKQGKGKVRKNGLVMMVTNSHRAFRCRRKTTYSSLMFCM